MPYSAYFVEPKKKNSMSCETTSSWKPCSSVLFLNAIFESMYRSSYENNSSAIDNSNTVSSRTSLSGRIVLPVEGMDICRKLVPSYNQ